MSPNQPKPNPQNFWQQIQPALKTKSLQALRTTIQVLEGIAEKLEEPPVPTSSQLSPSSKQVEAKVKVAPMEAESTGAANAADTEIDDVWGSDEISDEQPAVEKLKEAIAPPTPTPSAKPLTKRDNTPLPAAQGSLWSKWVTLLDWMRDRLPDSLSDRLSDAVLTSIAGGVLVLLVWTTSSLLPNQAEPVSQTPTVRPSPVRPSPVQTVPVKPSPSPQPVPKVTAPAAEKPAVTRTPVPTPTPTPTPVPAPLPPPPPLELTPEQSLIAAIQDQVAEITNRYANGLIQSIQANFRESRLIVNVSMGWYGLSGDRQNKLADEMLKRAQELDFSKLEITDTEGALLARSPIVGPDMIILQRAIPGSEAGKPG
jgi:hypothetical protein